MKKVADIPFLRSSESLPVGEVLSRLFKAEGVDTKLKEQEVLSVWPTVVGRLIASKTMDIKIEKGCLSVRISSPLVRREMWMAKEGVIRSLNERVGCQVVKSLILL